MVIYFSTFILFFLKNIASAIFFHSMLKRGEVLLSTSEVLFCGPVMPFLGSEVIFVLCQNLVLAW